MLHLAQHFAEACYSFGVAWPPACRDVWRRRGDEKTTVSATAACCEESAASRDRGLFVRETDTFNDKQSQIAERKSGDGRGPGDHSREERQIPLMTNSHKSQSEKLATGGGRETTAEKPDDN